MLPHYLHLDPLDHDILRRAPRNRNILRQVHNNNSECSRISCTNSFEILRNVSTACTASTSSDKIDMWIFDCGAIDKMTYDASDFVEKSELGKAYIQIDMRIENCRRGRNSKHFIKIVIIN